MTYFGLIYMEKNRRTKTDTVVESRFFSVNITCYSIKAFFQPGYRMKVTCGPTQRENFHSISLQ